MTLERDLMALKEKAEELAADRNRQEGQLAATLKTLKEDYGCATTEQAEKKLAKMDAEIEIEHKEIENECERIAKRYSLAG